MTELVRQDQGGFGQLAKQDRENFKSEVSSHAQSARESRYLLNEFDSLDQNRTELRGLLQHAKGPYRDILAQSLDEIALEIDRLGGEITRSVAREQYRQEVNTIIRKVNTLRSQTRVSAGLEHPLSISLNNRPQIPHPLLLELSQSEPFSPPLLHHGLGVLPSHQRGFVPTDLEEGVRFESSKRSSSDPRLRDVAISVVRLLPQNCLDRTLGKRPSSFRQSHEISQGVLDVTELILSFGRGEFRMPRIDQYAAPSADQEKHIEGAIRIILLHQLYEELRNPNVDENEYRRNIQNNISRSINLMAERIGDHGYELIAGVIESLPDIEAALLRSRFSITTDIKLGFPRIDLAHEKRFAEILNWAVYAHGGRNRQKKQSEAVDDILLKLGERVETGDLDTSQILFHLENLSHGPNLISQLYEAASDDNRAFLLEILEENGSFQSFVRSMRRKNGYDSNLDIENLVDDLEIYG